MGYTKQGFTKGTVLTADHLIAMEDGIIAAESSGSSTSSTSTATAIPSYWKSHMDTKVKEINTFNETYGGDVDSFIFITDMHGNSSFNYGNSPALINYIIENTSIKKVFFGGDMLQGGKGNAADMLWFRSLCKSFENAQIYPMRGNHDNWSNITDKQYWDVFYRNIDGYCETSPEMWYYSDDHSRKIRYIITDSVFTDEGNPVVTSDEQLSWMQDRITELEKGWTVLVLHHGIWTAAKTASLGEPNADGAVMINAIDEVYSSADAVVAGLYVGHCHRDNYVQADAGYMLVSTTCDANGAQASFDYNYPSRTSGTTTEHAFDVVFFNPKLGKINTIRIGAGANREFTYPTSNVPVPVEDVSLNATGVTMGIGRTRTFKATLTPSFVANNTVTWSVENGSDHITIVPDGLSCNVTANSLGTATLKVTTEDGGYTASCTIEVTESTDIDLTDQFTWTVGTCNYTSGQTTTSDVNWKFSNKVDVSAYSSIRFMQAQTTNTSTSLGYCFYTESGAVIAGRNNGGSSYVPVEKIIDVPSNAKYFRTMWYSDNNANITASDYTFYCYGIE